MGSDLTAREKLVKARAALVLDEPFFGALVLRLVPVEDSSCQTMWTDGASLGFNPAFVLSLSPAALKGCLCHEVLHCALSHHARRGARDPGRWNMAADYAVNPLIKDKFTLPDDVLLSPDFAGLAADEIYSRLPDESRPPDEGASDDDEAGAVDSEDGGAGRDDDEGNEGPGGSSGGDDAGSGDDSDGAGDDEGGSSGGSGGEDEDGGGAASGPGSGDPGGCGEVRDVPASDGSGGEAAESDLSRAEADWKVAISQAAQVARSMGKLPAGFDRLVDEIISPRVDWRAVLRRFFQASARSDYSWGRPNRRFIHAGIYLPSCRNLELGPVVVGVDASGSISPGSLNAGCGEVSVICEDFRAEVYAVYFDAVVQGVDHFNPEDLPFEMRPRGGGGTDFRPLFEWAEREGVSPSCVIVFTDLLGTFPEVPPPFPVLWVVEGEAFCEVPFGEVLEIRGE